MSDLAQELLRAWAVVERPVNAGLSSFPLSMLLAGAAVRVALDRDGNRHLLVPAGAEVIDADTRPSVLSFLHGTYAFAGQTMAYLDVICHDRDLDPEFGDLVQDLLECVAHSPHPAAEAARLIQRWRRMFRPEISRGLSEQEQIGLFAELLMLRALKGVDPALDPRTWTGPERQPHDFELADACLEVKAVGPSSTDVTIHGLEQLAQHGARPLHLVIVTLQQDPEGTTPGELALDVLSMFPNAAALRSLFSQAKLVPESPLLNRLRFSLVATTTVAIHQSVPRLVNGSLVGGKLPAAVHGVSYRVSLPDLLAMGEAIELSELAREVLA
jgi:hypothetical protein